MVDHATGNCDLYHYPARCSTSSVIISITAISQILVVHRKNYVYPLFIERSYYCDPTNERQLFRCYL